MEICPVVLEKIFFLKFNNVFRYLYTPLSHLKRTFTFLSANVTSPYSRITWNLQSVIGEKDISLTLTTYFYDVLWVFFSTDCLNRTTYATFVNKITPLHIVRNNLKFKVLVIFNVYRVLTLVMPMSKYQVSSMKETDVTLIWHIFPIKISMAARIIDNGDSWNIYLVKSSAMQIVVTFTIILFCPGCCYKTYLL